MDRYYFNYCETPLPIVLFFSGFTLLALYNYNNTCAIGLRKFHILSNNVSNNSDKITITFPCSIKSFMKKKKLTTLRAAENVPTRVFA